MYVELALVGDVGTLTAIGLEYMESAIPNWHARPGNVETIMIEGSGQIAGDLIDQASIVPPEALAALGTTVYGIPMEDGAQAVSQAIITFAPDTPAVTYPIDSMVGVPNPDGVQYVFLTDRDAVAPNGGGDVQVNLIAQDNGLAQNDSFGQCTMIDEVEGIASIVASGAVGGSDPETPDDYLDRLTTILSLPPRPVLPEDHAAMASGVPGVGRASVLNLYYPGTTVRDAGKAVGDYALWTPPPAPAAAASNVARCTTVCILATGDQLPTTTLMNQVYGTLDANREVNFLNFVMMPTTVGVSVKAVLTPYPGLTKQDAIVSSTGIMEEWLSTSGWGRIPGDTRNEVWAPDTKLRLYEVVEYLNRGLSTWYCESVFLKFASEDDTHWVAADLNLAGLGVFVIPTLDPAQLILT